MGVIEFLVILILALGQEVAWGSGLLLMWVVASAFSREPGSVFGWAFAAGILADLWGGRHLGVAAILYLVVAGLVVIIRARVPRQSKLVVSLLVVMLLGAWQLVLSQRFIPGELLIGLVGFWLMLPVAEILGREGERRTVLKLRQ